MGRIRRAFDEAAMRSPRGHLSLLPLPTAMATLEGEGGKLLARMSLAQGSLAASLVDNNNTVAVAASTVSPSTTITTDSTATSRTRDSTTRTRDSITRTKDSTTRTRTPGGASATTV